MWSERSLRCQEVAIGAAASKPCRESQPAVRTQTERLDFHDSKAGLAHMTKALAMAWAIAARVIVPLISASTACARLGYLLLSAEITATMARRKSITAAGSYIDVFESESVAGVMLSAL